MKRLIFALPVLMLLFGFALFTPENPQRVIVIGDSTAANYENEDYPRMGWAQVLQGFFDQKKVSIINKAKSGRSSKTFYNEPSSWSRVKAGLEQGDILFIQFGHNDRKLDPDIGTEAFGEFQVFLKKYIQEAKVLGATPVLMTPIHRNRWENDSLQIRDTHLDYLPAIRQVAAQTGTPLLDMAVLSDSLYEAKGIRYTTDHIFLNLPENLFPNFPEGKLDDTHLQEEGAYEIAKLITDAIAVSTDELFASLREGLLSMQKLNAEVSPEHSGYIVGPRYLPVNTPKYVKAFPAQGFEFQRWEVNGEVVGEWAQQTIQLQPGDTAIRLAWLEAITDPDSKHKVGISENESHIFIKTNGPVTFFRAFDLSGRNAFVWNGAGICDISLDKTKLDTGIYYFYMEWGESRRCIKVLVNK